MKPNVWSTRHKVVGPPYTAWKISYFVVVSSVAPRRSKKLIQTNNPPKSLPLVPISIIILHRGFSGQTKHGLAVLCWGHFSLHISSQNHFFCPFDNVYQAKNIKYRYHSLSFKIHEDFWVHYGFVSIFGKLFNYVCECKNRVMWDIICETGKGGRLSNFQFFSRTGQLCNQWTALSTRPKVFCQSVLSCECSHSRKILIISFFELGKLFELETHGKSPFVTTMVLVRRHYMMLALFFRHWFTLALLGWTYFIRVQLSWPYSMVLQLS